MKQILFILAILGLSITQIFSQTAKEYYNQGVFKYNNKDYTGSIQDFNKVIDLKPKYAEAYYNRGNSKFYIGDKDGACLDWNKADKLGLSKAHDLIQNNCQGNIEKNTNKISTQNNKIINYDEIIITKYDTIICNILNNANEKVFHYYTIENENPDIFTIKTDDIISVYNFQDYKSGIESKNLKNNFIFSSQVYHAGKNINSAMSCFIWSAIIVGVTSFVALQNSNDDIFYGGICVGLILEISGIGNIYSAGHRFKSAGKIAEKL